MSGPRFVPVHGLTRSGATVPVWPGGGEPVVGATTADGAWMSWRLLGANNRELGRSPRLFADAASCAASVALVREQAHIARPSVVVDLGTGLWAWNLAYLGERIAMGGRRYQRQRECRSSLHHFLELTSEAPADLTEPRWASPQSSGDANRRFGPLDGRGLHSNRLDSHGPVTDHPVT